MEKNAINSYGWLVNMSNKTSKRIDAFFTLSPQKMRASKPYLFKSTKVTIFMQTKHNTERRRHHFGLESFASASGILSAPDVLFFGMMSGNLPEKAPCHNFDDRKVLVPGKLMLPEWGKVQSI